MIDPKALIQAVQTAEYFGFYPMAGATIDSEGNICPLAAYIVFHQHFDEWYDGASPEALVDAHWEDFPPPFRQGFVDTVDGHGPQSVRADAYEQALYALGEAIVAAAGWVGRA